MEQSLAANPVFEGVEEDARSVNLLTLIYRICYNYKSHKYPPLGAWKFLDQLSKNIQPPHVSESEHYESVKTIIEVFNSEVARIFARRE